MKWWPESVLSALRSTMPVGVKEVASFQREEGMDAWAVWVIYADGREQKIAMSGMSLRCAIHDKKSYCELAERWWSGPQWVID